MTELERRLDYVGSLIKEIHGMLDNIYKNYRAEKDDNKAEELLAAARFWTDQVNELHDETLRIQFAIIELKTAKAIENLKKEN